MPDKAVPIVPRLSKSKYMSGLQCHKRLYLEIRSPELATPTDDASQARMDMGTEVGAVARQRFPGGVLVEFDRTHLPEALARTAELLADPNVPAIFEGTFQFEHVLVRVDILERAGQHTWRLIEVKASGSVKAPHLDDLAIQAYVLTGAGVALAGSCLMHMNTRYVYPGGALDMAQLFTMKGLSAEVGEAVAGVPARLAAMTTMLTRATPPAIEPDHHCFEPYACAFWAHCTQAKPPRWVFNLPGRGSAGIFQTLVTQGIESIDDIPAGFALNALQQRVRDNREWVGASLRAALKDVREPIHHLDFETFNPAIPRFPQTRPYQVLPFQWSNHVESRDGAVAHHEYLCGDNRDPREEFIVTLLESLGQDGSICIYSAYERTRLNELAAVFPKLKPAIDKVLARLWDLLPVIRNHYYHPAFEGSYSLKAVVPAVVPALHYGDLAIQGGNQASGQYYRMVFEVTDMAEKARIREALLEYCKRDTLAMVELRKILMAKSATESD